MKKIIAGNWKMYGSPAMAEGVARAVALHADALAEDVEVVICPPATLLAQVSAALRGARRVCSGGQACHARPEGAFTGDISAAMLREAGARYVILGHSERRRDHMESDAQIRQAAEEAMRIGLIPILCVGESEEERNSGRAQEVVGQQVGDCLPEAAGVCDFVLAYEPVWAIGSGSTPTIGDIAAMHAHILAVASARTGRQKDAVTVLYGGSVKADNAQAILHTDGVGGVLVGGASLRADEFCRIVSAAL